ncbi:hypothetical protein AC1031_000416 [Aphanomyces cochlioides]|nr:hypothetical protein AC1031_000416 [Aphanomyces cochlioides]
MTQFSLEEFGQDIVELEHMSLISTEFALNHLPPPPNLHVLVVTNDAISAPETKKRKSSEIETPLKIDKIKSLLPPPSSFGMSKGEKGWIRIIKRFNGQIECHRFTNTNNPPIPIALLHIIFAKFQHNRTNLPFGSADCDFVEEFCAAMSEEYKDEDEMAEKARVILGKYLLSNCAGGGLSIISTRRNKCISDGSLFWNDALVLNLEVKLQRDEGRCDPSMQNVAYYIKYFSDTTDCALPCLLLDICGPFLSVFGIVNIGDGGLMTMAVRVFASLKVALEALTSQQCPKVALEKSRFPYHASAVIDGRQVDIEYQEHILHYVFVAKVVQTDDTVVVKFAKQYGSEVHRYCAKEGFAPALLQSEELTNNWIFIVMEKLELIPLCQAGVDKCLGTSFASSEQHLQGTQMQSIFLN